MKALTAMYWEIKMDLLSTLRYRFSFISDVIVFIVFLSFFMLTDAGSSFSDKYHYSDYKALLLIGYIAWVLGVSAISTASNEITSELQRGTFYIKLHSKSPLVVLLFGKLIATILIQLIIAVILILLSRIIWSVTININIVMIFALLISTVGMFGVGLIIAGMSLLFKRTGAITFIVQIGLLFITDTIPSGTVITQFTKIFPLTSCNEIIRLSLSGGEYGASIYWLMITAVIWVIIGIALFNLFLRRAKRNGNLLLY